MKGKPRLVRMMDILRRRCVLLTTSSSFAVTESDPPLSTGLQSIYGKSQWQLQTASLQHSGMVIPFGHQPASLCGN